MSLKDKNNNKYFNLLINNIIKRESRAVIRPNYIDKKHYRIRKRHCQLKLT